MNVFQAIILAITQGVTEFLPISSSGHLAILQIFWQLGELSISFDALLHFGTLGAILAVFYQEIKTIFKNKDWKIIKLVIIGTIPATLFGLLFQSTIENQFTSLKFIGFAFLITGLFLLLTKFIKTPKETSQQDLKGLEDIGNVSWFDALIIGVAQSVALFPGISRSGMTIAAGLFRKLKPETAYKFSFLLAIPVILGAVILQIPNLIQQGQNNYCLYAFSALITFLTGMISLKALSKILKEGKLFWFSFYLFVLGIMILII